MLVTVQLMDCPVVGTPTTSVYGGRKEKAVYGLSVVVLSPRAVRANLPKEYEGREVELTRTRLDGREIDCLQDSNGVLEESA